MQITASQLTREITIQRYVSDERDGVPQSTYETLFETVPASYRPLRGSERFLDGKAIAQRDCEFIVRWCDELKALTPADRIIFEERHFDIQEVTETGGRRMFLSLKAKERDQSNG